MRFKLVEGWLWRCRSQLVVLQRCAHQADRVRMDGCCRPLMPVWYGLSLSGA